MIAPAAVGCKRMLGCRCWVYNQSMSSRAQELLRQALELPLNERADQLAREAVATRSSPGWREIKNTYVPKSDGPRG